MKWLNPLITGYDIQETLDCRPRPGNDFRQAIDIYVSVLSDIFIWDCFGGPPVHNLQLYGLETGGDDNV